LPELAGLAGSLASGTEVRATYDAVQQFDGRVMSAMHAVPVPAGLANRILDRLAANASGAAATAVAAGTAAGENAPPSAVELTLASSPQAPADARFTRGRWIAVGTGLAACLLLAAGLVIVSRQPDRPQLTVTEKAVGWYEQLGDGWQPMAQSPQGLALPKGIGGTQRGWQWVAKSVAKSGVVYDLGQDPHGPVARSGAVLFVIKGTRPDLPSSAPRTPQSTTAGYAIGAWQSGGLMYVLVVRGNEQAYEKLLHPVRPLA
jgi:hypothetical protein